jgi:hypothetical protein
LWVNRSIGFKKEGRVPSVALQRLQRGGNRNGITTVTKYGVGSRESNKGVIGKGEFNVTQRHSVVTNS